MKKLTVEYPPNTKSPNIVWGMISTAEGLQKWLADIVVADADGETMTFTWGHPWTDRDTKTSQILECDKFSHIRMKWDYQEEDPQAFWEIRLEQSELTGHLSMLITDYADPEDIEDLRGIWDENLDRLHRVSGL